MKVSILAAAVTAASLIDSAFAEKSERTFAVLRFWGKELTRCRIDPVVNPGADAGHLHSVVGGGAFTRHMPGDYAATESKCTQAKVAKDFSNYWTPSLYFNGDKGLEPVPMYYMNIYYFFDKTHDKIEPFPPGFRMLAGDVNRRTPPVSSKFNLNPADGEVFPSTWTCPRNDDSKARFPDLYPTDSDGTSGCGIGDSVDKGSGFGFSDKKCTGLYSPLRADIHFPSCYDPSAGPEGYKNNTAYPIITNGYHDCPDGYVHVPHLFFEVYWDTQKFDDRWTEGKGTQPWTLANGDTTGYSLHGDFLNGWEEDTLRKIIDTCDAGTKGMDQCPGIELTPEADGNSCIVPCDIHDEAEKDDSRESLPTLFGKNSLVGYTPGNLTPKPVTEPIKPDVKADQPKVYEPKKETKPATPEPKEEVKPVTYEPKEEPKPEPEPEKLEEPAPPAPTPKPVQPIVHYITEIVTATIYEEEVQTTTCTSKPRYHKRGMHHAKRIHHHHAGSN